MVMDDDLWEDYVIKCKLCGNKFRTHDKSRNYDSRCYEELFKKDKK